MSSKYFQLEEFLSSDTAKKKNIQNIPSWNVIDHLRELAGVLDIIRTNCGFPISISSGFRNEELNKAVKGAPTSAHKYGYAADLIPSKGTVEDFAKQVKSILDNLNIRYDELIFEQSKTSKWLHFAIRSYNGEQRMKTFSMQV